MRTLASADRIRSFMQQLGAAVKSEGRVYLTGGASALLIGWRETTMDIDLHADPEPSGFFESLPLLKDTLDINIELAAPCHFIPELPGWRERSLFIQRCGRIDFHHFDFYSQALSKIERGYERDILDLQQMLVRKLIEAPRLKKLFLEIEPSLIRYPSLRPDVFGANLNRFLEANT